MFCLRSFNQWVTMGANTSIFSAGKGDWESAKIPLIDATRVEHLRLLPSVHNEVIHRTS